MRNLVMYCKSHRDDVLRARRLAQSVLRFNVDALPFYMTVPARDLTLFKEKFDGLSIEWFTDEEIIKKNPGLNLDTFHALPGGLSQQVVKSEFWRGGLAEAYVCLDSDCYFIRPFRAVDFVAPDAGPYTVMHEAKELLLFAELSGMRKIARDWERGCEEIKRIFVRDGRCWDFGPVPVVWSGSVWKDLDERYLQPRRMTIIDAINAHPAELRWYGEALLAFGSIPILPIEPLFRCYHYEEQYYFWKRLGETEAIIAQNYLGVCMQSNWDKQLDLTRKFKFSKFRRALKRFLLP